MFFAARMREQGEVIVDIPLGEGLCLRLRPQSQGVFLSFALPYREWLGHKEVVHLEYTALRELAGEKAPREEFFRRLKSALSVLASIPEDVEEIFKPNPLGP